MISNAANMLIFAAGRLTFGRPPLVPEDADDRHRRGQRAAAGADPDRDRHRLRAPGLRARARLPLLLRAAAPPRWTRCAWPSRSRSAADAAVLAAGHPVRARRCSACSPGARRRRSAPSRSPARWRCWRWRVRIARRGGRGTAPSPSRPAAGRRPSASPWSPTGSRRSWCCWSGWWRSRSLVFGLADVTARARSTTATTR